MSETVVDHYMHDMHARTAVMGETSFARILQVTSTRSTDLPIIAGLHAVTPTAMSQSLSPRIIRGARAASKNRVAATIRPQVRGQATTTGSSSNFSPLRYHIFAEPLPYLTGLKLQHDIIDRRLKLKAKGQESDDIVLLLGMINPNPKGVEGRTDGRTYTDIYDWTTR